MSGRDRRANKGGTAEETLFRPLLDERGFFIFGDKGGMCMLDGMRIGFIGAGAMAEAIIAGLLANREVKPEQFSLVNRLNRERLLRLARKFGLSVEQLGEEAVLRSDVIILAVKPKDVVEVLRKWGDRFRPSQLLISVAAGIRASLIEQFMSGAVPVVRAMPNTSCAVRLSVTALCSGSHANKSHLDLARKIFSAIGSVFIVKEEMMDAVTGLFGSGPAYVYAMVEALEKAGVTAGLQPETARSMTVQTLLGAAHMLIETGKSPDELRQYRFDEAVVKAVERARERAREMGEQAAAGK
jgi:pyrroline-5-carboxylate reductase